MHISKSVQKGKYLIPGLFIILILVNLVIVLPEIGSFGLGILRNWDQTGLWRSARFASSANYADYIQFLKEEIPEDAIVIIPPKKVSTWELSDPPTMQFFLAPRTIVNCLTVGCGSDFIGRENTYILIMGLDRFPGTEIRPLAENISMHNDTWGVYGPADGLGTGDQIPETIPVGNLLKNIFLPLHYFIFVLAAGYFIMSLLLPNFQPWMRVGLGYGFVMGINSFVGYLLLYFGIFEKSGNVLLGITALTLLVILLLSIKNRSALNVFRDLVIRKEQFDIWVVIILLFGIGYSILSVGTGFYENDSIGVWGVKSSGIISEGLKGVITHGTNTTAYPLHIPVTLSMIRDYFGDSLPAGKLIFPLYYLSLLLVSYEFLNSTTRKDFAGLGTLVLATMPLISRHAMIGYANLSVTFYLVAGVILLNKALTANTDILPALSGLFFGFVIWTRPEGLWFSAAIYILIFVRLLISDHQYKWRQYFLMIAPPLLLTGVWIITKNQFYIVINPAERNINTLIQNFLAGIFNFDELTQILGYFFKIIFDVRNWGSIGLGMIAAIILTFVSKSKMRYYNWLIWSVSIICILLMIGMYYVLSFDDSAGLDWWLTSGFYRMIMPGAVLMWLGIVSVFTAAAKEEVEAAL